MGSRTPDPPLLIREDAAFHCVGCGSCCEWQYIGPVSDEDLRRLHEGWDLLSGRIDSSRPIFFTSVVAGLARFVFGWLAARALAIVRAQQMKRGHVLTPGLTDAMGVLAFLFRCDDFVGVLTQRDEPLRSLFFELLPALVERREERVSPETRLERFYF